MEGGGGLLIFSRLFVLSKIFFILAFGLVLLGETINIFFDELGGGGCLYKNTY
uniref:Uncharacterized protein n=1 Tax=Meloidogyne enterolobii TaxID=390850 RepID=A0A6V7UZM4_MELEN|nr:unnamed protein product [Meloidogyne enterolobii]